MAQTGSQIPVGGAGKAGGVPAAQPRGAGGLWRPFDSLRQEVDRLFEDFGRAPFGLLQREPLFARSAAEFTTPAVDVVETPDRFEISAELPGIDQKNIELKISNGSLVIKGEKKDEREEKTAESYLSERRYGMFERSFALPDDIDAAKIEATFANGVLKVRLPKKPEAQKSEQKIEIKPS